jgi:hypothetical protein
LDQTLFPIPSNTVKGGLTMIAPLVRALIAHGDSVFVGPNGDYAAVLETIASMPVRQALWKPVPTQNSIWQIVEHLIVSKEWLIETLEHGQAASPDWVEPSGDEATWQDTLARLKDAHQRLRLRLEQLTDADLLKASDPEGHTLLELILSAGPAHEAHHSGQIDYLRGLQVGRLG